MARAMYLTSSEAEALGWACHHSVLCLLYGIYIPPCYRFGDYLHGDIVGSSKKESLSVSVNMAPESSPLAQLDALLSDTLSEWNIYSTAIATVIVAFIGGIWFLSKDPDCHPFLLARQSTEAPIRQQGESGSFRSLETPYGYPLRTGLNVKDPGAPKWTAGRNGDLRDIWRSAVRGTPDGTRGKLYTVLGKSLKEHNLDDISQEINILGKYARDSGVKTAVVRLSDSVELLSAIFGR